LAAGQTKTGINITLPVGGTVSGNITTSGTTDPADLRVVIFRASDGRFVTTEIRSGLYSINGLLPGTPYTICFDGRIFTRESVSAPYGSAPQCYNDVPWSPGTAWFAPPS
jgi:hypothetical protein